MKRLTALVLAILLLAGCSFSGSGPKDPVTFYYLRTHSNNSSYDDFFAEGVIGSEEREVSGHRDNLHYLLSIYFRGPLDPELTSPFPAGCAILDIRQKNSHLTLQLNAVLSENTDLDITLACACLAQTCLALTDADTVLIESRDLEDKILFSRTFTGDSLFLRDDYTPGAGSTESTQ